MVAGSGHLEKGCVTSLLFLYCWPFVKELVLSDHKVFTYLHIRLFLFSTSKKKKWNKQTRKKIPSFFPPVSLSARVPSTGPHSSGFSRTKPCLLHLFLVWSHTRGEDEVMRCFCPPPPPPHPPPHTHTHPPLPLSVWALRGAAPLSSPCPSHRAPQTGRGVRVGPARRRGPQRC